MLLLLKILTSLQGLGSRLLPNTGVKTRTMKRSFNWTYREIHNEDELLNVFLQACS